jgi:hypothetical protein
MKDFGILAVLGADVLVVMTIMFGKQDTPCLE